MRRGGEGRAARAWRTAVAGAALVAVAAAVPVACKSAGVKRAAQSQPSAQAEGKRGPQRTLRVNVAAPPGVEDRLVLPRSGESLARAQTPLAEIVAGLPLPAYLAATTQPAATRPAHDDEPPIAAQRAYIQGRQAWLERRGFDAIRALQNAETLAPNNAEILRFLGQIYTASGNKARGGYYLERAVKIDPADLQSLFLLGRFALEQGKWNQALVTFAHAQRLLATTRDADPALRPLVSYSLGGALDHEGYDAAAIEQYELCLAVPPSLGRTTGMGRELMFLARQRAEIWRSIGDAYNRLDRPEEALAAYRRAGEEEDADEASLVGRTVYTRLRLGQPDAAQATAIDYLGSDEPRPESLGLVRFLGENGVDRVRLAERLRGLYDEKGKPAALAVTIAELQGSPAGFATLEAHLRDKPEDRRVFEQLVRQAFADQSPGSRGVSHAAAAAVSAIAAKPTSAREYGSNLIETAPDQPSLRAALAALLTPEQPASQAAATHYLLGRSHLGGGAVDAAMAEFEKAIAADAGLIAARLDRARILVAQGKTDEAEKLLEGVEATADADVIEVRARVLARAGKPAEALRLVDAALANQPHNIDLVLQKAGVQRSMNNVAGAERTLLDALDTHPQEEKLYVALFAIYDSDNPPPDSDQQFQRLMLRLMRTLPQSRLARLKNAGFLVGSGQGARAEPIIKSLLSENPRDFEALDLMLEMLSESDRKADADALLRERLAAAPNDSTLLMVAFRHYSQRVRDRKRADEVLEPFLLQQPASPERSLDLARLYLRTKRFDKADGVLEAAAKENPKFGHQFIPLRARALAGLGRQEEAERLLREAMSRDVEHAADLMFALANLHERAGQRDKFERVMQDLLLRFPGHPMANNSLGYTWANQGRKLEDAKRMIEVAQAAEPSNAAYLDSLGWVYYKMGRFGDAVRWLQRARTAEGGDYPVILDHLGDALFRLGNKNEAAVWWSRARQLIAELGVDPEDDPEIEGLDEHLKLKIEALQQNKQPPVAEVADKPGAPPAEVAPATPDVEPEPAREAPGAEPAPAP